MTPEVLAKQLDGLVSEVVDFRARSAHDDCSDVMSETKAVEIATRAYAAVERISGKQSPYHVRAEEIRRENAYEQLKVLRLMGVLQSLSADLKAGYLQSLEELIHGELFGDLLEMAQHLADSGYKDAAAVIAGSSLEAHLRQLGKRFGVAVEHVTSKGSEPEKADLINADLVTRSQLRLRRFDQFSTFRSVKREKSFVLIVTTTSLPAWAIAAICPSTYGTGRPSASSRARS